MTELKEDIILNREIFTEKYFEDDEFMNLLPLTSVDQKENIFEKYTVNLFLDNSENTCAPVILEQKSNYTSLVGSIELDTEANGYNEHLKIKPGALHKANNGYLILKTKDLLSHPYAFEVLINSLETSKVDIEPIKEQTTSYIPTNHIKPDSIYLDLKVLLIGTEEDYEVLSQFETFSKVFKVTAFFDYEMDNSDDNIVSIINLINEICKNEDLLTPDDNAINIILQYLNREAETQNKFSTNIENILEILIQANYLANISALSHITEKNIIDSIKNKTYYNNMYEEKLNNMIYENDIMIQTSGFSIAQVNGLAVLDYGNHYFGKPSKVTATTYVGEDGVINIEKEANISGNIHNKGIQVLSGYLGQKYAQNFPLSLSCNICLEQNYSGVDGDSCTSTELYTILSSLSNVPINQEIAVTGSINQKGEIQSVGGVTQKIEGFFHICQKRNLTGTQGVIIPYQNIKDLCLDDDVIDAVKENKFSIYTIKNVDEGIEILTGVPAGKLDENNNYPENSIHFKVYQKLKEFSQNLA